MKNGYKYKIDINSYNSTSYPVALYRWKGGRLFGHWEHVQSHKTQQDAQADYDAISDQMPGLPRYL